MNEKIEVGDLVQVTEWGGDPKDPSWFVGPDPWTARVLQLYKTDATELLVEPDPPLPECRHKRMALSSHDKVKLLHKSETPRRDSTGWVKSLYPSHDIPIAGQLAGTPCPWCNGELGGDRHGRGSGCMAAAGALATAKIIGEDLRLVSDTLQQKACVFGEEPLDGARTRVAVALGMLDDLLKKRVKKV